MKKILFVCSGNTCRSPLAEAIAKEILSKRLEFSVDVSSAGVNALDGLPASPHSLEVAHRHGLDLSGHRSRLLSRTLVREADLIVTLGVKHRETVGVIDPDALEYTFLLTNFSDSHDGDIPDPMGADLAAYEGTYRVIRECVESMGTKLERFDGWRSYGGEP